MHKLHRLRWHRFRILFGAYRTAHKHPQYTNNYYALFVKLASHHMLPMMMPIASARFRSLRTAKPWVTKAVPPARVVVPVGVLTTNQNYNVNCMSHFLFRKKIWTYNISARVFWETCTYSRRCKSIIILCA